MPVIYDIDAGFAADEVERLPGLLCRGRLHKHVLPMVTEILDDIEKHHLLQPALAYGIVPVKSKSNGVIELEQGSRLYAPLLAHRLARASGLAFGVATIGSAIAETIEQLFRAGRQFKAVLMEEIANACLYKVSMQFQQRVDDEAGLTNLQTSGTLAPGDEGFDLSGQDQVLALSGAAAIHVSLSGSFMMKPRHSVSSVIGIGRRMQKWTQIENCSMCKSRERCPRRQSIGVLGQ